jgi:hypothetical protein
MQLIAMGKWSKADKRWNMVVALRRPISGASDSQAVIRRPKSTQRPHKKSDR